MKINSPEFPQLPLGTDAQSFLSQLALRYFTVTCLMQMRRFMFIHGESYRPPFIPQASSANQQSAVCTTVELGSPRKGTPEQIIAPDKHAQRVSKLKAVRRVKMFPGFTPCSLPLTFLAQFLLYTIPQSTRCDQWAAICYGEIFQGLSQDDSF